MTRAEPVPGTASRSAASIPQPSAERSGRVSLALFFLGVLVLAPGLLLGPPDAKGTAGALRVLAGEVFGPLSVYGSPQ